MLRGFAISTLVHASVLAMAMLSWPNPESDCDKAIERLRRENPGIRSIEIVMQLPQCATSSELPIDFEDVGLVSDLSELRKAPDPAEDAVAPESEPEIEPAPAEPVPEEAADQPEEAVPDPLATKTPDPKKPDPKKPDPAKTEPLIKKQPPKKPKEDDLAFLDEFESVLQDKRQTKPRSTSTDRPALGNAERDRDGEGNNTGNTASIAQVLKRQITECWNPIDDLPREDQIIVEIRVLLEKDGSLSQAAELVSPKSRPVGRKGIAVDRALGAVRKCEALGRYKLPEEHYEVWKDIVVAIGPEQD